MDIAAKMYHNSRLTSMTYPNGKLLNYNYATGLDSNISRLTSLSDTSGTLESYSYLGLDTVVQRARSQISTNLTYIKQTGDSNGDAGDQYIGLDRFGRIVDQRWLNTGTLAATDRFQYGYDRDSNALYRNNLVNTAFGELYHASGPGNGYDNLNQLSGFLRGVLSASGGSGTPLDTISSPSTTESWSPDAMGNFSSITTNGSTQTRTHNQQNEITSISSLATPTYDANGNLTKDEQGQTYKYDAWNRLVQVKNSGSTVIAQYAYDGMGRRIQETHGSTVNDLYYSAAWQVLEERTGGVSTATIQYVWSPVYVDALVLRDRSTQNNGTMDERLWVQQDANWNVTALVNGSGQVVERYDYDPFGQVTYLNASFGTIGGSAYGWLYGFQGLRFDTTTGNIQARRRDQRPTMQRFLENDPIGIGGGDTNFYRFLGNNPPNGTDPHGTTKGGKQNIKPSFIRGNETEAEIEALVAKFSKQGRKGGKSLRKLGAWLKVQGSLKKYAKKFGKRLPLVGAGISLYVFAEDAKACGVVKAGAHATPVLGDIMIYMEDLDEIVKEAEASADDAYEAFNNRVQEANKRANEKLKELLDYELDNTPLGEYPDLENIAKAISDLRSQLFVGYISETKIVERSKAFGLSRDYVIEHVKDFDITKAVLRFQEKLRTASGSTCPPGEPH